MLRSIRRLQSCQRFNPLSIFTQLCVRSGDFLQASNLACGTDACRSRRERHSPDGIAQDANREIGVPGSQSPRVGPVERLLLAEDGVARAPIICALVGKRDAQERCFIEGAADQLQTDGQAIARESAGDGNRGESREIGRPAHVRQSRDARRFVLHRSARIRRR